MKFLFRSGWGESLALARRVEAEGNLVRFSIIESTVQTVGQGLIPKTKDFLGSVSWADVIVFDSNTFDMPSEAEKLRLAGKNVVGASELSGRLEKDRQLAASIARRHRLEVNDFKRFSGKEAWIKARQFLADCDEDEGWVWKPDGEGDVAPTYVASTIPEMLRMLEYFETLYLREKQLPEFILTPKIEGKEVSTEAWFDGQNFFLANNTIEKNRFFNKDLGEKTGCAGNVVWVYPELTDCPLFGELLKPLAQELKDKYRGPIDVNAIIEDESQLPIFLEFTPRFGYDAIFALSHLIENDLAGLLADTAMGRTWRGQVKTDRFAGALRIHIPPYPEGTNGRAEGVPIFGFDPSRVQRSISPCEVRLDSRGQPETAGEGYVFVLSAEGRSPEEAMKKCLPTKDFKIPLMRYRTDLDFEIQKEYGDLLETSWIKGPSRGSIFLRQGELKDELGPNT